VDSVTSSKRRSGRRSRRDGHDQSSDQAPARRDLRVRIPPHTWKRLREEFGRDDDTLRFGRSGGLDYFLSTVFNYPTLAECYKVSALNAANKLAM
jgi:hypothetical protein